MGSRQSWRKAYGALKDHTKVGLAHVNSDFKDVDVAIVKATNHVEYPPKDRHIRKILAAISAVRPRADVAYCLHALAKRLTKTHNWTVALKTLIVIHRALREGDPTFREELVNFQQRGRILRLSNFKDDSSPIAWDLSAWVRTYALFLEERLECFRALKYDIEAERIPRPAQGPEKGYSRTRELDSEELLEQLPALQQLLYRLIGCRPEGAASANYTIQYALALVLKESFKIYCAINDGIINLVDKFFEMPRHEAIKASEIYKRAGQQAVNLSEFYQVCKGLALARNYQFPVLREPPQSFLATMEEYIREAPQMVSVPREPLEYPERLLLTYKPQQQQEASLSSEDARLNNTCDEPKQPPQILDTIAVSKEEVAGPPPPPTKNFDSDDLLGLNAITQSASTIEESNALALAIVPSENNSPFETSGFQGKDWGTSGWELALVTAPSHTISPAQERQLAGGMDTLILNSLYDNGEYRASQQPVYGAPTPNPFEVNDPFGFSNNVSRPSYQMANAGQHQQPNPFNPFHHQASPNPHHQQNLHNPFVDSTGFGAFPAISNAQTSNPFRRTALL